MSAFGPANKDWTVASQAVVRYFGSVAFGALASSTQQQGRAILERFRLAHGDKRIAKLQPEHLMRLIGKLRPYAQRYMLKTLRGLMAFALTDNLIDIDPAAAVKLKPVKASEGFETWPVEAIEQYRKHHKLGTRARLAMELLYGTMAARADVVRLGTQHFKNGLDFSGRRRKPG